MSELMAVPLDGGGAVVVESDDLAGSAGVVKAGRGGAPGEVAVRAAQTLEVALEPVTAAARATLAKLREANPDRVALEFGLRLTAEVGAVITKTAGQCNLKVTLIWERSGDRDPGGGRHPGDDHDSG
jgi:Trypsin-co-occurring domain 1